MPKTHIEPVYYEYDHERGETTWGLGPEDFDLVRLGYACGYCLEVFSIGGTLVQLPVCPVKGCKRPTALQGVERVMGEAPDDWVAYEKERQAAYRGES